MVRVFEGEWMGHSPGDESLALTRCHSCGLLGLYEALDWKSCSWPNLQTKGHKVLLFLIMLLISWHDACRLHGGGRR